MSAVPDSFLGAAANDADAQETREWLDALSAVIGTEGGERAHFLLEQLIDHARQAGIDMPFSANTAYVNTIPTDQEERTPGNIEIEERLRTYMRWNAMAMVVKANRLHPADGGDLGGHISSFASLAHDVRHRLQPLLARRERRPRRRPALHPGPLVARHLRARLHGRPHQRGAAAQLPPGGRRQGHLQLPAPEADARVLAVPDRLDGPGPADGDLPGALPEVPARARHRRHREPQGLGVLRRRRDGRARVAGRHRPGGAREARQPDLRHQLQPAAPGRPGARQRQDHPGARRRVPRLGLERHQAAVGQLLGPAARARQGRHPAQGDDGRRRRRLPGDEGQRRRLRAQELLRPPPQAAGDGRQDERRGHLAPAARRPRPAEGLRGLPPRQQPQGPADRAADQDGQGLRHGQERRGQEHRAPDQEADRRGRARLPRPLQHPDPGRPAGRHPVLQAGRRHAGDALPARAPQGAGRLPAQAPHQGRRAVHRAGARHLQGRARAHRRRPRDQHHAGLRALPDAAAARQGAGPARRAHPGRRGAHLRHGRPVPPDRHLQPRRARSTRRSTRTRSCTTAKTRPARSCRKASTRPAAWAAGSPRRRRTRRTTASWCRSTSTTRCSASSASATWPGRRATCRRAASCSAAPRAAPRSTAKACSTRTATATSWPARSRTASATTRPSRTRSA